MPLIDGYSDSAFQQNVDKLISEGYKPSQAVAIAREIQSKAKARARKSGKLSEISQLAREFVQRHKP